ncbi:MAG: hypothetical protein IT443_05610 [Phycisphaeraceae bacterium]|nr:hypothetical protein [Phycisphaeraceae bacterium]
MNWFERICRHAGLTVHHLMQPIRDAKPRPIRRQVEEKKVNEQVTLRRTTIEEIQITPKP